MLIITGSLDFKYKLAPAESIAQYNLFIQTQTLNVKTSLKSKPSMVLSKSLLNLLAHLTPGINNTFHTRYGCERFSYIPSSTQSQK